MMQEKKRSKKNSQTVKAVEAVVLIGVFLVVAGYILYSVFMNPKRMDGDYVTEAAAESAVSVEEDSDALLFCEKEVVYDGRTYRRNTYVKAILCIGVDRPDSLEHATTTGFGGQADGIILVVQDTARNSLKMLMIPRDTMTMIPMTDLSGNLIGKGIQHLNLAYAYGDGKKRSCEYMVEAVSELLLGLPMDYYLAADMEAIVVANDLIGGVTVTIPTEGMEQADPSFVKGSTVTLHGEQADRFVRFRDIEKSNTALYRMDQQQEYLAKFYETIQKKAMSDSSIVVKLFDELSTHIVTDMGKELYLKMALDALESEGFGSQSIFTLPGQGIATGAYDEFYPDKDGMIRLILDLFYREET